MRETVLEIKNIYVAYDEENVLTDVSLEVFKGEVLCIVGESGSGKSTLVKAITGDKKVKLTKGSIEYNGRNITCLKARDRQKILGTEIGFIQQNPWGAFNPIRRLEAQFKETAASNGTSFDRERVKEIFDTLGLKDPEKIIKCRPYELSGGMSQRVAIAASFFLEPKVLLCDEITSALDVTTAAAVCDELCKLKQTMGTTIVMVTHNLGMAARMADRIAIMYKGKVIECGEAKTILESPKEEYTIRLLRDVPRLEMSC